MVEGKRSEHNCLLVLEAQVCKKDHKKRYVSANFTPFNSQCRLLSMRTTQENLGRGGQGGGKPKARNSGIASYFIDHSMESMKQTIILAILYYKDKPVSYLELIFKYFFSFTFWPMSNYHYQAPNLKHLDTK